MFQKIIIVSLVFLAIPCISFSQQVSGTILGEVVSGEPEVLPGANVYWSGTTIGTTTGVEGEFALSWPENDTNRLVISFVGYENDTLVLTAPQENMRVILGAEELDVVDVTARSLSTEISMIKPVNMETIGQAEIKKAACCNLSESFESNASVDVVFSDAVSGTRAIQMLGLSGVYTQLLSENVPLTRGLSASQGLQYIPGTWVESIQITKGVGSVVNGYEAMTGQINIEFLKPENKKTENLFVNLYGNNMGRPEANIHFNKKFNDKASTLLFLHSSGYFQKNDANQDNFLDNPLSRQLNVFNRWKVQGKKAEQVIGVRFVADDKTGGQVNFNPDQRLTSDIYGIGINTRIVEGFIKNGFLFPSSPTRSMGIIASGKYHSYDSFFGVRAYKAEQKSGYLNVIFQDVLSNTMHNYKAGLSYVYDEFDEQYTDSVFSSVENVPGVFAEYTYNNVDKLTLLLGARGDYHDLYGLKFTPRFHLRYSPGARFTYRISAGTGFRTPHVFIENMSTLASSREVKIDGPLLPEETYNAGTSITYRFMLFDNEALFNLDYYYTFFKNQVIADMDTDPHMVWMYNLQGESYSHSIQADIDMELYKGLALKTAYKHYIVKAKYNGILLDKPMVPASRVMANLSYHTPSKKWKYDLIANWFSDSRLPKTSSLPENIRFPERSEAYLIMHFQITKLFRKFEVYIGAENILDKRQNQAIMAADEPFGPDFDASMIWGPLNGRTFYGGLRWSLMK